MENNLQNQGLIDSIRKNLERRPNKPAVKKQGNRDCNIQGASSLIEAVFEVYPDEVKDYLEGVDEVTTASIK